MTMHSHDRYRLLAAAALDRPLDPADEADLQEHLARCASCRSDVARMRSDHALLADLPDIAPDPRVYDAVMAAARSHRRGTPWSALAVAAVLLLGGIGGAVLAAGALDPSTEPPVGSPSTPPTQDQATVTPEPTSPEPTAEPSPSPGALTPTPSPDATSATGRPRWGAATNIPVEAPARWVAAGDVDGDGHQDLVASLNVSGRLAVLMGRGDGRFRPAFFVDDTGIAVFDLVDVTGDEALDVVGAFARDDSVAVLEGDGRGGFTELVRRTVSNAATRPVIEDLDGDGDVDMAVIEEETGVISVLDGRRGGRLAAAEVLRTVPGAVSIAGGDLDGDGTTDLVATGESTGLVTLLLSDPGGGQPDVRSLAVPAGPYVPAVDDMDGDGIADIVVVHQLSGLISVLRGAGGAAFEPAVILEASHLGRDAPDSPALHDLDGDGDLDLLVAATLHDHADVFVTGAGGLPGGADATGTGSGPINVAAADFNEDGRPDLATANSLAPTVSVLLAR